MATDTLGMLNSAVASSAVRRPKEIARDYIGRARSANRSFSQAGEDRIANFVLGLMHIDYPVYLDLGAHHPTHMSNTFLFYVRGSRGLCVEADPELHKRIARRRPRDTCVNAAVAPEDGRVSFHVMDGRALSTVSAESVESYQGMGRSVARTIEVDALSPRTILQRHFQGTPHLVSLDVEGLDMDILRAWDLESQRPEVLIAETADYGEKGDETKRGDIAELMESIGYFPYGDTFVNTVFVDREAYLHGRRGGAARVATLIGR
jgi:FkbM family methyltransferase